MNLDQFLPTSKNNLAHFLKPRLKFSERLLCIAIGTVLNRDGFLTRALDQRLALLLGLLAVLQCVLLETLRFGLGFSLLAQTFLPDLLEFLQALGTVAIVLISQLSLQLNRLLIELLTPLESLLLQLLTSCGVLLLKLGQLRLAFMLQLGGLLTG